MKLVKLWVHQKGNFGGESIVVNPKEFPNICVGDVVEIYHLEDESRLLLQVLSLKDDFQQKDTISVEQSVANAFNLRTYKDVQVNIVDPKSVSLDLMEIVFREQYYSRSDMWRLSKTLVNTCVYASKKIEFAEMRAQVNELWAKGEKMTCGYVTEDTRVVYRSSTAAVSIFIQMSSEMWEFDGYGDLYFEKAVCGFLAELFAKWKENNCSHDVTIVMFSRTFYDAQSKDDLPPAARECITQDYKGRFYEDFYRVVVQNERYDEWTSVLIELKKLFVEYPKRVLHFHDGSGRIPRAWNSTAAQGNFLEVINMSLNAYEKYYIDRNFDRTGKVAVVVTPGAGVFEVDRELMNVTKQRTIDYGVGADIVCMAEQPLHAVPLFKFHNKNDQTTLDVGDDYNLPHWINISFYHSPSQVQTTNSGAFVPRIKLGIKNPNRPLSGIEKVGSNRENLLTTRWKEQSHDNFPFVDYDEYDSHTFKLPNRVASLCPGKKRSSSASTTKFLQTSFQEARSQHRPRTRTISDDYQGTGEMGKSMSPKMSIPYQSSTENLLSSSYSGALATTMSHGGSQESVASTISDDMAIGNRCIVGSDTSLSSHLARAPNGEDKGRPHRALINPFAPMRLNFKMTSNRRRWIHAFPTDPQGTTIRSHYHRFKSKKSNNLSVLPPTKEVMEAAQLAVEARKNRTRQESSCNESDQSSSVSPSGTLTRSDSTTSTHTLQQVPSGSSLATLNRSQSISKVQSNASISSMVPSSSYDATFVARTKTPTHSQKRLSSILRELEIEKTGRWLWGPPGEKEWSTSLTMAFWTSSDCLFTLAGGTLGVDWKSLCYPAQLPMTTDYFPDQEALQKYYVFTDYSLLPDDYNQEVWQRPSGEDASKYNHKPLTTGQVFKELISQRLAQGFQLIVQPKSQTQGGHSKLSSSPHYHSTLFNRTWSRVEQSEEYYMSIGRIFHKLNLTMPTITVTRYRPRHSAPNIHVHYRYRLQVPDSTTYDISWADFRSEQLESYNWNYLDLYICTRGESDFGLVESLKFWRSRFFLLPLQTDPATEKIIQGSARCDIYEERCVKEQCQIIEGYLRFIETINKIKRPSSTRKPKISEARRASHEIHCQKKMSAPALFDVSALRRNSDPRPTEKTNIAANPSASKPSQPAGSGTDVQESKPEVPPSARVRHPSMPAKLFMPADSTTEMAPLVTASNIPHSPAPVAKSASSHSSTVISQSSSEIASVTVSYADSDNKQTGNTDNSTSESDDCLTVNSPLTDIVDAMLDQNDGLSFLPKQPGLPQHCFVSAEAVAWVRVCVEGVSSDSVVVDIMQKMVDSKLICHPSNDPKHKFINGFFLFYILPEKERGIGTDLPINSLFQSEWCEVEIDVNDKPPPLVPPWFVDNLPSKVTPKKPRTSDNWWDTKLKNIGHENFKQVNVDVDASSKSDRKEWGIAFYHSKYNPLSPFSLEIQWLVATGCIMGELIYSYARKATSCGFHFLPVPLDQFALPYTPNSDPQRGPVFIPLNVSCLKTPGLSLFGEFKDERPWERLELFQDAILKRFGFMRDLYSINLSTSYGLPEDISMKYVHCTGGMFALIPNHEVVSSPKAKDRIYAQKQQRQSAHKDFITRHLSMNGICDPGPQDQIGFIWSWNFMLTKRWRTSNTGDEHFQDKVLQDFRDFCNNEDNRLKDMWDESWEKARRATHPLPEEAFVLSETWSEDPIEGLLT